MNTRRQILKALFHCIEPRKRAKHRKMRRPDMSGNIYRRRAQLQRNLQKVMAVHSEDRPPVRMDVSDLLQFICDTLCILKPRENDHTVDLSHLPVLLIDRAYLPGDDKTGNHLSPHAFIFDPVFILQHIQPVLRRRQLLCQLLPPCRVRKVSCPHDLDALSPRPEIQMLRGTLLTGRPRIPGMDVQICYIHRMPPSLSYSFVSMPGISKPDPHIRFPAAPVLPLLEGLSSQDKSPSVPISVPPLHTLSPASPQYQQPPYLGKLSSG